MLKKKNSVLIIVLCVLMLFSGCAAALPENSKENSAVIKPGTTYIAAEAVFRSQYTSYIGPTYSEYDIMENSFIIRNNYEEKVFEVLEWKWVDFPCTEEQWLLLFDEWEEPIDIFKYGKIMYQPIDDCNFFLLVNGEIWSTSIFPYGPEGEWRIVMIDKLIPEDYSGSAKWEYAPALSSKEPFFNFEIDAEFSRIGASCSEGRLVDVDKPYFQLGYNIVIDENNFIRWSAADYEGTVSAGDEINFQIYQNGDNTSWVYSGKIKIHSEKSEHGRIYTAKLISDDLLMKTDENTGRIYIFAPDTYLGSDEETGENQSFWHFVPFG